MRKLIALVLLVLAPSSFATDYFVRTDGADSHTGLTNDAAGAWATVNKCLTTVSAGDRCRVQDGEYQEENLTVPAGSNDGFGVASCSCTHGSTTISCGTSVASLVSAGQWVRCDSGNTGFYWTRVASVSSSTITLDEGYRGVTAGAASPNLDVANMVELRGDGTNPEDVVITQWEDDPGVTWTKTTGQTCVYEYTKSGSVGAWAAPHALREEGSWASWDLWDDVVNEKDPYLLLTANSCPCGTSSLAAHVDQVPGSWADDGAKVYVQTWGCVAPGTVTMQAGDQGSNSVIKSTGIYSVVSNLTVQASAMNEHSANDLYRTAFELGATNSLYRDLVAETGKTWINPADESYNVRFEHFRMLNSARVGTGDVGLMLYDVEMRGGHPNQFSTDRLSGRSSTQRVTWDRVYLHRGWTHHRSMLTGCNQQPNYDCSSKTWASQYRATHGAYWGSISQDRLMDHITIQNSIFEITFDGFALFTGSGSSDIVIRNNTFGYSGDDTQEFLWLGNDAGGSWSASVYNNVFFYNSGAGSQEGGIRHAGPGTSITADHNLYLYSGRNHGSTTSDRAWNSGETLEYVISNYSQETNSIMVCGSGCGGTNGTYYNDGADPHFVDWRTDDGDGTDYTPMAGFRGLGQGLSSECPDEDFYGNTRGSGACDIGAVEEASCVGTTVSACGTLSATGTTYCLDQDLSAADDCFTITGDNITLDLDGHTITFNTDHSSYVSGTTPRDQGVYIQGADGVTVTDGYIVEDSGCTGTLCTGDRAVDIGGSYGSTIDGLNITVQGYDAHGVMAGYGAGSCDLTTTLTVTNCTITHNGTDISSRDSFTGEPIKIERQPSKISFTHNTITNAPQAGIVIDMNGMDSPLGCQDGSEIAYNDIDIDNALYANCGGIHINHGQGIDIHDNNIHGDGQEGIQVDSGEYMASGGRLKIRDNTIDVDCNYWPKGHTSGPGALQGIRMRYNTLQTDIYGNTITVHADDTNDTTEQNSAVGIYITCHRTSGSDTCTDVKVHDNTVTANVDGTAGLQEAIAFEWGGVDDTYGDIEVYNNTFKSQEFIFYTFDDPNEADSSKFHDNTLERITGDTPKTVHMDYSKTDGFDNAIAMLDTTFVGGAGVDDIEFVGSGPTKHASWDWSVNVYVTESGSPVDGASVTLKDNTGATVDTCTTVSTGHCTVIGRQKTHNEGSATTDYNDHTVEASKGGSSGEGTLTVDAIDDPITVPISASGGSNTGTTVSGANISGVEVR